MYDQSGIDISSQRPRFRAYRNARGGLQVEGRIYYRGPMQPRGSLPRVKLDLTADERLVHPPVDRAVAHPYSDRELYRGVDRCAAHPVRHSPCRDFTLVRLKKPPPDRPVGPWELHGERRSVTVHGPQPWTNRPRRPVNKAGASLRVGHKPGWVGSVNSSI